jgi:ATP-dependent Lon protease
MAAYLAGVKRIFIPKDNARDIDKTDIAVRENVEFVLCETVDDLISGALIIPEKSAEPKISDTIIPIVSGKTGDNLGASIIAR